MTAVDDFKSPVLSIDVDGHVATLWLDRPEARNALGPDLWADLPRAAAALGEEPDVRVLVIAARGPHFSVGLDLKSMGGGLAGGGAPRSQASKALRSRVDLKRMQDSVTAVEKLAFPVIAAVHGYCIGGGVDLIACCDIRLASVDAVFSVRETKIAIVADLGSLQRLPRILSAGHLAELAYTGKDIAAARAKEIGLVNDVYDDQESLMAAAYALAGEIAANSPLAVQGTKAVLAANEGRSVAEGLDYVAVWNAGALESEDLKEAMTAFMEKRPAVFQGR
jgi:enoyl-CoA hydratase